LIIAQQSEQLLEYMHLLQLNIPGRSFRAKAELDVELMMVRGRGLGLGMTKDD
jgi:hypothetical protein